MATLAKLIGQSGKGNKRAGRRGLYADLLRHFQSMYAAGMRLPRQHLSREAAQNGLFDILLKHEQLEIDPSWGNTELERIDTARRRFEGPAATYRNQVAKRLARVFTRVSDEIMPPPTPCPSSDTRLLTGRHLHGGHPPPA